MKQLTGLRVKAILIAILVVLLIGACVNFWPESKLWAPIATCGQLLSAVAVFFLTLNFIIEKKREAFKDIESAIAFSDRLQALMIHWDEAMEEVNKHTEHGEIDLASPEGQVIGKLARRIQDEIVRYSIMIESGAVNIELVEKYPYLNRDFVNLFIRFDVSHAQYGIHLSTDWEIARPIVDKIIDSRQSHFVRK